LSNPFDDIVPRVTADDRKSKHSKEEKVKSKSKATKYVVNLKEKHDLLNTLSREMNAYSVIFDVTVPVLKFDACIFGLGCFETVLKFAFTYHIEICCTLSLRNA
jgi:hypothetical protein